MIAFSIVSNSNTSLSGSSSSDTAPKRAHHLAARSSLASIASATPPTADATAGAPSPTSTTGAKFAGWPEKQGNQAKSHVDNSNRSASATVLCNDINILEYFIVRRNRRKWRANSRPRNHFCAQSHLLRAESGATGDALSVRPFASATFSVRRVQGRKSSCDRDD